MRSQLTDAQMDIDNHQNTSTADNAFALNQLEVLRETIGILANGAEALNRDGQRLNNELPEHEMKLQRLLENVSQVKVAVEEENALLEGMTQNLEILHQDLASLKEKVDEKEFVSYDGTFMWRITQCGEKRSMYEIFLISYSSRDI